MAISDSFNVDNALNSQSYAYKCWYNYNYESNTMGISSADMGKITKEWKGEVPNWKDTATGDENAYEIEDDDYSTAKENGANQAKEKTGFDGGKSIAGDIVDGVAGAAVSMVSSGIGSNTISKGMADIGLGYKDTLGGHNAVSDVSSKTGKKTGKLSDIATVVLASATAAKYWIQKPNKDQKEACDVLQNEMTKADASLGEAQKVMDESDAEMIELSDEAQTRNEDANEDIEDNKTEFDMYKTSYNALKAKSDAGVVLSKGEQVFKKELVKKLDILGENITLTTEDTTESVGELCDEIESYQTNYDEAASTVAKVEGLTDYAESFDSATQTGCYIQMAAQTANATGAAIAASKLVGKAFVGWAFAAMGYAAAASSGIAATQQIQWAGEVGTEIGMREATQELNNTTSEIYDERIADYEGSMENTRGLELEIPDDLEVPQEDGTTTGGATDGTVGATASTGFGIASTNENDKSGDKKDKEEKA